MLAADSAELLDFRPLSHSLKRRIASFSVICEICEIVVISFGSLG